MAVPTIDDERRNAKIGRRPVDFGSLMPTWKRIASLSFLASACALGVFATVRSGFESNRVLLWFLLPYYGVTAALQYVFPFQPNRFEEREVLTDVVSNLGAILMGAAQTALTVAIASYALPNLLVASGVLDARHTMSALPFVAQVLVLFVMSDFLFYWAHRLCHENAFLWRFHSVHHCAHRISVLNASRVHPIDLVFRRIVPMLVTLQITGADPDAVLVAGVVGSVLGTITHMNTDSDHGFLNYLIGTNQVHRWHHSSEYDEARNFGLTMTWDHLFGTYFFPSDRDRPTKFGLGDERLYPLHSYLGQLLVPFRWAAREAALTTAPKAETGVPDRATTDDDVASEPSGDLTSVATSEPLPGS